MDETRAPPGARAQRRALAAAALAFAALTLTIAPPSGAAGYAILVATSAAALGLALVRTKHAAFASMIVPIGAGLIFSFGAVAGALAGPAPDVVRLALMCGLLAPFLSLISPTRRAALAALAAMSVVVAAGALLIAARAATFDAAPALVFLLAAICLALAFTRALETARADGAALRAELERRATSDEITGVSNRAHIGVLAQNEFSRARRYGEPFSCLAIEVDGYQRLLGDHGPSALTAVVKVLTGYCVVVMRHCDSFGRLAPSRFLALLPETPAAGARTLAKRMCADLAGLGVAFAGDTLRFTVSIGIAEMHPVDASAGDLVRRAEQGIADALERGGNCAVLARVPASPAHGGGDDDFAGTAPPGAPPGAPP